MVREQHAERALVARTCRREEGSFIGVAGRGLVRHRFVTGVKRAHPSELIGPQGGADRISDADGSKPPAASLLLLICNLCPALGCHEQTYCTHF